MIVRCAQKPRGKFYEIWAHLRPKIFEGDYEEKGAQYKRTGCDLKASIYKDTHTKQYMMPPETLILITG